MVSMVAVVDGWWQWWWWWRWLEEVAVSEWAVEVQAPSWTQQSAPKAYANQHDAASSGM